MEVFTFKGRFEEGRGSHACNHKRGSGYISIQGLGFRSSRFRAQGRVYCIGKGFRQTLQLVQHLGLRV